jgi:hypothetical protein
LGALGLKEIVEGPLCGGQENKPMKKFRSFVFAALLMAIAIPAFTGTASAATRHPHHHRRHHHRRK